MPPEKLLSAPLIHALYGNGSERQLMEQLDDNLLYRWFVGLSPDDAVWDPTTLSAALDAQQPAVSTFPDQARHIGGL